MCCDEVEPSAGSGMPKDAAASIACLNSSTVPTGRRRAAGAHRDTEADDPEIGAAVGAQVTIGRSEP